MNPLDDSGIHHLGSGGDLQQWVDDASLDELALALPLTILLTPAAAYPTVPILRNLRYQRRLDRNFRQTQEMWDTAAAAVPDLWLAWTVEPKLPGARQVTQAVVGVHGDALQVKAFFACLTRLEQDFYTDGDED